MSQLSKLSRSAKTRKNSKARSPIVAAEDDRKIQYIENLFIQDQLDWVNDTSPIVLWVKSRRIGATWAEAYRANRDCLLDVHDTTFSSYNLLAAKAFIDDCAKWAKAFNIFTQAIFGVQIIDEREILGFSLTYPNGRSILAVASNPENFRGRQGVFVRDEAAFGDDNLDEVLKATRATIMRGGQLRLISTLNGINSKFTMLWKEYELKPHLGKVYYTPFDRAIEQGMYRSYILAQGQEYTKAGEIAWAESIIELYGEDGDEELQCIPSASSGNCVFRPQWFQFIDISLKELALVDQYISMDVATTDERKVDETKRQAFFTAQVTAAIYENKIIIINCEAVRLGASEGDDWICEQIKATDYTCQTALLEQEGGSAGEKWIAYMKERVEEQNNFDKTVKGYEPAKSKVSRALPTVPLIKNRSDSPEKFTIYLHESLRNHHVCSIDQSKKVGVLDPTFINLLSMFDGVPTRHLVNDVTDAFSNLIDYLITKILRGF